jgi:hypothetical protein
LKNADSKINITLSINKKIVEELKGDAESRNTSLNSLVNEILSRHVTFYKKIEELEMFIVPPKIFSMMLSKMDESDGVGWLTMAINDIWNSLVLEYNMPNDVESFAKFAVGNIARRAGICSSSRYEYDGSHRIVISHKYGAKWSKILAGAFSASLEYFFKKVPQCKIADEVVELKFS